MAEPSNHWRTFGLAVIAAAVLAGVLAVGYVLGADGDSSSASQTSSAPRPDATEPTATTQGASAVPTSTTSTTTTTTTTTTQPAPPSTFFQVDHWSVDLMQQWRSTDPSLAAAWYVGSFPPATQAESVELVRAKQRAEGGTRGNCRRLDEDGGRYLDLVWPEGAYGALNRLLSSDEATRMMHQMLQQHCPENA